MKKNFSLFLLILLLLAACQGPVLPSQTGLADATLAAPALPAITRPEIQETGGLPLAPTANPTPAPPSLPFRPPAGKILMIMGQDVISTADYVQASGIIPAGVTEYTDLQSLAGIASSHDNGSGPHYLDGAARDYPQSVLVLGLYLVGYLDSINQGKADKNIDTLLQFLAGYNRPVYLRFGYEFDGEWNRYPPAAFKQAWIYFHDRLQARGVSNVAMVWQSAAPCDRTFGNNDRSAWYPGDAYVDWVALSYFTQGTCALKPLNEIAAFAREHQKPLMIAESTPRGYDLQNLTFSSKGKVFTAKTAQQIWAEWYADYFDFIYRNADVVQAVAYINANWDAQPMWGPPHTNGYWGDSRVQANPEINKLWMAEMSREVWLSSGPDLFKILGFR